MSDTVDTRPDYIAAVRAQRQAADPKHTRLVSANAGSGKTRVLVDRVSRLLLSQTAPEKILCLTYTKAAASEMQSRLFSTLGEWSVLPEERLTEALQKVLGDGVDLPDLKTARALFAKALETPEGLKVQTIHAFCERILSRFPIEAGILPGFEPLEDADIYDLQARVKETLLRACAEAPEGPLNAALQLLARDKAEQTLDGLFEWMSMNGEKIAQWEQQGLSPLAEFLGIEEDATADTIATVAWTAVDPKIRRAMAADLGESPNISDRKTSKNLLDAFDADTPAQKFETYAAIFFTAAGSLRKKMTTAKALERVKAFYEPDGPEVTRVATAYQDILAANCLEQTRAVFVLAQYYRTVFNTLKRRDRRLDFSDQILLVRDLLSRSDVSEWIRYKLDGGIEHILVDEAQDTAPAQWDIIDALAAPFFEDTPDRLRYAPRTLFAVGDEKQSIYSFQGAEPERFLEKIRHYTSDANPFEQNAQQIRMQMSFRSAPSVLRFVDQIFVEGRGKQRMFSATETVIASDLDRHTAHRTDPGQVEFWPLALRPETENDREAWDTRPVDALGAGDAREQLAVCVAQWIKTGIEAGTPVFDRSCGQTRPMVPGDVLVLVRRRDAFFDAIIRNLKTERVPVAGADRLQLKDSIAVQDLLSLARFTLLPGDDLALAEVLKSPIFNYSEEDLFAVAVDRDRQSLWAAVQSRRPDTSVNLSEFIRHSRRFAPYEFFARVLATVDRQGISLTERFYRRLSMEVKDALEAFLGIALSHQRNGAPSLQQFVQAFSKEDPVLKREMDAASDGAGQVRVMTVHGAKGLEAPIVFLPDTTQTPKPRGPLTPIEGGFVMAGSSATRPATLEPFMEAAKARDQQEYMRLLYVAMTRAESRLILCGYQAGTVKTGYQPGSWYEEAKTAMDSLQCQTIQTPFGEGLRFGQEAQPSAANDDARHLSHGEDLPTWARVQAAPEGLPYQRVTPSHLLVAEDSKAPPVRSPLTRAKDTRFGRGIIIHKLLEILPEVARDRRAAVGHAYLNSRAQNRPKEEREAILSEVLEILEAPEFADLFGPGSRAEVSLAGRAKSLPETLYLNGQIDRLCVTKTQVLIVDYKSNRPPPIDAAQVAPIYLTQMAAYRELAREIYPNRTVRCALLWTDGPTLMQLSDSLLDQALTQVRRLLT